MTTEVIITGVVSLTFGVGGWLIGYYKSTASMAKDYVSKKDCENCAMKNEISNLVEDVKDAAKDLKKGNELFTKLRIDVAVIKTKLGIKADLEELKGMVDELENGSG